jgi:acetyl-CoA carboxylase biotin carboxyl carrier protein
MDLKELKQLVRLMVEHDLTELDMESEGGKVKIKRNSGSPEVQVVAPHHAAAVAGASAGAATTQGQPAGAEPAAGEAGTLAIKSPMVGTFYTSPSPDAPPFVSTGDAVDPNTVVCIVEAMKVFNEIKAEVRGTIVKVLVENGQAIEFDQPLFLVKPD